MILLHLPNQLIRALLKIKTQHLLDTLERKLRALQDGGCGPAQVVDYHTEESIPKLNLILQLLNLLIRANF